MLFLFEAQKGSSSALSYLGTQRQSTFETGGLHTYSLSAQDFVFKMIRYMYYRLDIDQKKSYPKIHTICSYNPITPHYNLRKASFNKKKNQKTSSTKLNKFQTRKTSITIKHKFKSANIIYPNRNTLAHERPRSGYPKTQCTLGQARASRGRRVYKKGVVSRYCLQPSCPNPAAYRFTATEPDKWHFLNVKISI